VSHRHTHQGSFRRRSRWSRWASC